MKILITGGAGFIGSHVANLLISKNNEVVVIDNLSVGKRENINEKAVFYKQDICEGEKIKEIFKKESPDIVIHAAANSMLRKSLENPVFDAMTNIIGTINILEACKENNVKKIIYTSTGGARFGEPEYLPVDEKHPVAPCSPYGISKHTAEHYVLMYNQLYGLDCIIFCFGNVYGPGDDPSTNRVIPLFIKQVLENKSPRIFGSGNQTRDFIYVIDLAEFLIECLDKIPEHKLFNLSGGEQISVNNIFEHIKEISDFDKEAEHAEGIKGEINDILLDNSLVKNELGWSPKTNIKEGIKKTYAWFKNNYDKNGKI